MNFSYCAVRRDGALEAGSVPADSAEIARQVLSERGLLAVEVRLSAASAGTPCRMPLDELALGLRSLSTLLASGLAMGRALATLTTLAPPSWRRVLPTVTENVRAGRSFGAALETTGAGIPPVMIGIIRAGEAGSALPLAISRAADLAESDASMRTAIRGALAYPVVLVVAFAAAAALLVDVVIPRFAAILADLGQSLPLTTRIVLDASLLLHRAAWPAVMAVAVGVVVFPRWVASPEGARAWHRFLLRLPLAGDARLAAATARVCAALAALLESGVPISTALAHAARAAGDEAVACRARAARERVIAGVSLSQAARMEHVLTDAAVSLIRAGEESGRLGPMLAHAAHLERSRAEQATRNAVRLLEPALILVFGGMVAIIAAALLQAIYSVRPT